MIPKVRSWKVTAKDTGKVIYVDTINKRFARWIANTERGMWGHDLTISVVKEKPKIQYPPPLPMAGRWCGR